MPYNQGCCTNTLICNMLAMLSVPINSPTAKLISHNVDLFYMSP